MDISHTLYINQKVEVIFRPIHSGDEQLWLDFLNHCSVESIYSRFHSFFRYNSFDIAHKFCSVNEKREIALVAEINESGNKEIVGIGRLISDTDHKNAEFAILVADNWQKKHILVDI
jgi:acetyltransferase